MPGADPALRRALCQYAPLVTTVNNTRYASSGDGMVGWPPRQLIVTIFGLYARIERDWLPISAVVRLMAELGVDSPAVRSSISRLKRRDVLRSVPGAGVAGYAVSPAMLQVMADGDRRIFDRRPPSLVEGWVQVVFTVPEAERGKRHELRSRLARLGFGPVAPGVWLAPGRLADEVREMLSRRQLTGYVDLFHTDYLGYAELAGRVRDWWDLADLSDRYCQFLTRYRPVPGRLELAGYGLGKAFAEYVRMLTSWRRLRYLDPGLPIEVLPADWPGTPATELFAELNQLLRPLAHQHASTVIDG
jgi:phenylacetic acid degradation operon negative regulatory protein